VFVTGIDLHQPNTCEQRWSLPKCIHLHDTLTYYVAELIMVVKSFTIKNPILKNKSHLGINFTNKIYRFLNDGK
jgi:hypothetical protein